MQGIGNDIIEIERILKAISRHGKRFLDDVFTQNEQIYCSRYQQPERHYAGRFAAKEAVVKALGTGFSPEITWLDIQVLNDAHGKPCVILSDRLNERFMHPQILLSISHCKTFATAVAVYL